ncbi:MAG: hypothetical protein ACM3U2_08705 [Deltaproteobacteria bacterium]
MPTVPEMSLRPELRAAAALLERGSESIRAVTAGEQNRFTRAFEALNRLALANGTQFAIVGGLAAIHFGYPAITEDIAIVVARDALDRLLADAPRFGFKVTWRSNAGWHTLQFEDVEINIVPEGGKARDSAPTTIPGPTNLGVASGLGYSDLPGWIELKLSAGRAKDRTHIVEVLKSLAPEKISEIRRHVSRVHSRYRKLLDQLIEEAKEEKRQEGERGRHQE